MTRLAFSACRSRPLRCQRDQSRLRPLLLRLISCSSSCSSSATPSSTFPLFFSTSSSPKRHRVVSLLPSATEILSLIEAEDGAADGGETGPYEGVLVGRSHECDFPAHLRDVPVLTNQAVQGEMTSSAIDAKVRASLKTDGTLYSLDRDLLRELAPTVVLTQDLCSVCSIDLDRVEQSLQEIESPPKIVSLNPYSLGEVLCDVLTVGKAIGMEERAERVHQRLHARLADLTQVASQFEGSRRSGTNRGLNVAFVEWMDPIFVGGHWTPELINMAGATHPLNEAHASSISIQPSVLLESDPDYLIVSPCGFDIATTLKDWRSLTENEWWGTLRCVREGNFCIVDGNQHFNRPGPRLLDALQFLIGYLHKRPDLIPNDFPYLDASDIVVRAWQNQFSVDDASNSWEDIHAAACAKDEEWYVDPYTGYNVMTEVHHQRRGYCCGNGCRHCPYAHWNVKRNQDRRNQIVKQPSRLGIRSGMKFSWDHVEKREIQLLSSLNDLKVCTKRSVFLVLADERTGDALLANETVKIHKVYEEAKNVESALIVIPVSSSEWNEEKANVKRFIEKLHPVLNDVLEFNISSRRYSSS